MSARPRGRAKRAWGVPRSSAGSEGVKKSRKWVATVRKIRTLEHVANPISEFLHTLSAGAIFFFGGWFGGGHRGPLRVTRAPRPDRPRRGGSLRQPGRARRGAAA